MPASSQPISRLQSRSYPPLYSVAAAPCPRLSIPFEPVPPALPSCSTTCPSASASRHLAILIFPFRFVSKGSLTSGFRPPRSNCLISSRRLNYPRSSKSPSSIPASSFLQSDCLLASIVPLPACPPKFQSPSFYIYPGLCRISPSLCSHSSTSSLPRFSRPSGLSCQRFSRPCSFDVDSARLCRISPALLLLALQYQVPVPLPA